MKEIFWRLHNSSKVDFPCRPSRRLEEAFGRQLRKSEFDTCSDGPANANHQELLFETCLDGLANANHWEHPFTRMSECRSEDWGRRSLLCKHPDTRVRGPDTLQQFYEDAVSKSGRQKSCSDVANGSLNLNRIRISFRYCFFKDSE
jgi:hypothetical protein